MTELQKLAKRIHDEIEVSKADHLAAMRRGAREACAAFETHIATLRAVERWIKEIEEER